MNRTDCHMLTTQLPAPATIERAPESHPTAPPLNPCAPVQPTERHQPAPLARRGARTFAGSRRARRGFNLIELLIALSITAALLTATLVALNASFMAYQSTTEQASTHTIGRMLIHRLQALVRTGRDFEPMPVDPTESIVNSTSLQVTITTALGADQTVLLTYDVSPEEATADAGMYALFVSIDGGDPIVLLDCLVPQYDEEDELIPPFTLEYVLGHQLYRATIDLTLRPDDNMSVTLDGQYSPELRLVASAMPRSVTF